MKKDKYANVSTEELIKKKKSTTAATSVLAGLLIVLCVVSISEGIRECEFPYDIMLPIALSPIVFINFKEVKAMKKELEQRKVE